MSEYGRLQNAVWTRLIEGPDAPLKDAPVVLASKVAEAAVEAAWDFFKKDEA